MTQRYIILINLSLGVGGIGVGGGQRGGAWFNLGGRGGGGELSFKVGLKGLLHSFKEFNIRIIGHLIFIEVSMNLMNVRFDANKISI